MALTSIEGASAADPADSLAGGVGVRGGGDQVVVHVAVEPCLLGRALLLDLEATESEKLLTLLVSSLEKQKRPDWL